MKAIALAILLGLALIAGAILATNRYALQTTGEGIFAWRIDQLTGETRICRTKDPQTGTIACYRAEDERIRYLD